LTYTLIILNLVVFLFSSLPEFANTLYMRGEVHGYEVLYLEEWYRLISAMFLHNGLTHILFNMVSLYMVGSVMERLFSRMAYLGIYFVSGIVGGLFFIYFNPNGSAVGASGAIFGIFGALAGFSFVYRKTHTAQFMEFIKQFGIILLLNFLLGVLFENIAMSAHIGGLLSGMLMGALIARFPFWVVWINLSFTLLMVFFYYYLQWLYIG